MLKKAQPHLVLRMCKDLYKIHFGRNAYCVPVLTPSQWDWFLYKVEDDKQLQWVNRTQLTKDYLTCFLTFLLYSWWFLGWEGERGKISSYLHLRASISPQEMLLQHLYVLEANVLFSEDAHSSFALSPFFQITCTPCHPVSLYLFAELKWVPILLHLRMRLYFLSSNMEGMKYCVLFNAPSIRQYFWGFYEEWL